MADEFKGIAGQSADLCCGSIWVIVFVIIALFMLAGFWIWAIDPAAKALKMDPIVLFVVVAVVMIAVAYSIAKSEVKKEKASSVVSSVSVEPAVEFNESAPVLGGDFSHKHGILTQEEIDSLYDEGVEFIKRGQLGNAIKKFDIIIKIDPDHAPTWNARAVAMEKMGNLDQAFISVVNALKASPTEQKYLDNYHKLEKKLQNRR